MPKESPDQIPLIPPEQIIEKEKEKKSKIDPNKDPFFRPTRKRRYPFIDYQEIPKPENSPEQNQSEESEQISQDRQRWREEPTKRIKEIIKFLDEKDKKK